MSFLSKSDVSDSVLSPETNEGTLGDVTLLCNSCVSHLSSYDGTR